MSGYCDLVEYNVWCPRQHYQCLDVTGSSVLINIVMMRLIVEREGKLKMHTHVAQNRVGWLSLATGIHANI